MLDWLRGKRGGAAATAVAALDAQTRARDARERGNEHLAHDRFEEAAACFEQAAALDPADAAALVNLGFALCSLSRAAQAREWLQRAVALQPDDADAHYFLGVAREQSGDLAGSGESYTRAIALKPDFDLGYRDLCRVLVQSGQVERARSVLSSGLAVNPGNADLHFYDGNLLLQQRQFAQAAQSLERAASLAPGAPQIHAALGQAYAGLGRWGHAAGSYGRALETARDDAQTHNLLGAAQVHLGQLAEAVASFRRAAALQPGYAEAHSNLGNALRVQGHLAEAVQACQTAVHLQPSLASAHNNLGTALAARGSMAQALESYRRAVSLESGNARFQSNYGGAHQKLGALEQAIACYRRALEIDPQLLDVRSNLLFAMSISQGCTPEDYLEQARVYGRLAREAATAASGSPASKPWTPERPLRIGLVSGDFRNHPVGFFLESTLRCFDRSKVELVAYSTQPLQDALTARLRPAFDRWRELWGIDDARAAQLVRDDGIDVLVDLAGHSQHNRLPMFAHRPARVQVSWLGFFASTGVREIDYFIADPVSAPEDVQAQFTERIWLLPHTRLCITAPEHELAPGPLPALRNGYITFGNFQNASKFNAGVFRAWATILKAVPGSRLRVQGEFNGERSPSAALAAEGIDPGRIDEAGLASRNDYLHSHHQVDLILDTFPYPGGTTTCEALWMGVPTVTLSGSTLLGRQGASLMTCAGLSDWVAHDLEEYVATALRHTSDLPTLAGLRATLRQRALASPLYDAPRFAADLQDAFRRMAAERR